MCERDPARYPPGQRGGGDDRRVGGADGPHGGAGGAAVRVFLNLLAATAGGQLSRARAFLHRFHRCAPTAELIVIKESAVLVECVAAPSRIVVNVPVGLGHLKAMRRMWWENARMPRLIREHAADVYLTFSHYLPQSYDMSLPSVVGVSNLAPFSPQAWADESWPVKLKMMTLRRSIVSTAQRATSVLALSETCRDILIGCGVAADKISVTANGVESYWGDVVSPTGHLAQLGIVMPFVLYVSHFHRYKNHARLVEAYSRLPARTRETHQLVLAGRPYSRSCYENTRALIGRHGLAGNVVMLAGEDGAGLRELYQCAKLFIFPSLIENSPNILLEAMMAGAPVAAGNLRPMPEVCGSAAEYFDPLDIASMSSCLEELLNDPPRLAALRLRSRKRAGQFSWDSFVSVVVGLCEKVAGQGPRVVA